MSRSQSPRRVLSTASSSQSPGPRGCLRGQSAGESSQSAGHWPSPCCQGPGLNTSAQARAIATAERAHILGVSPSVNCSSHPSPRGCSQWKWKWRSHLGSPGTGPSERHSPGRNLESLECEKGQKEKAGLVSFLPDRHFLLLSAIPTSAAKPGTHPDLSRPRGPLHTTLRSHDSSSLLPAPAQSRQKPCCLSSLRAKRPRGSQGQVDPRTARARHLIPEQVPLPKPAFLQPTACCSPGCCPSTMADHPSGQRAGAGADAHPAQIQELQGKVPCPRHTSTCGQGGLPSGL